MKTCDRYPIDSLVVSEAFRFYNGYILQSTTDLDSPVGPLILGRPSSSVERTQ
jgi:hypothetical protein